MPTWKKKFFAWLNKSDISDYDVIEWDLGGNAELRLTLKSSAQNWETQIRQGARPNAEYTMAMLMGETPPEIPDPLCKYAKSA